MEPLTNAPPAIQASSSILTAYQSIPLVDASASTDIIQMTTETASPVQTLSVNFAFCHLCVSNVSRMPPKMPTEFVNATPDTSPATENAWNAPQPVPPAHQPPTAIPASKTKTPEALPTMAVHV